jgi:hypothetical protein
MRRSASTFWGKYVPTRAPLSLVTNVAIDQCATGADPAYARDRERRAGGLSRRRYLRTVFGARLSSRAIALIGSPRDGSVNEWTPEYSTESTLLLGFNLKMPLGVQNSGTVSNTNGIPETPFPTGPPALLK